MIPDIKLKNGIWQGRIILESWDAFFKKDNYIELNIGGDSLVETLEAKHIRAYRYILSNQDLILKTILNELLDKYPKMQEEYGYDEEEIQEYMPNVYTVLEFDKLLFPKRIYILNVGDRGVAYTGFQFECMWDDEQEFGVMMYENSVIKMGGADTAFLSWIAEDDKGSRKN